MNLIFSKTDFPGFQGPDLRYVLWMGIPLKRLVFHYGVKNREKSMSMAGRLKSENRKLATMN